MDDVFATRLKALRLSHRLKLKDVGDAVGCSFKTIGNLENAKKAPSLTMAMSLARFFDVSLEYFLGRADGKINMPLDCINQKSDIFDNQISNKDENEQRVKSEIELKKFSPRLRDLRLARRMTQRNVGEAVGYDMKTINNVERAHQSPSIGLIVALADFFNVSADYLVGWSNYKADADDRSDETAGTNPSQSAERKKLIGLIENMREENIDKAMSYISYLENDPRRADKAR